MLLLWASSTKKTAIPQLCQPQTLHFSFDSPSELGEMSMLLLTLNMADPQPHFIANLPSLARIDF